MNNGDSVPNPGSDEAVALGCSCPILDNNHGRGFGDGLYWINGDCRLHGTKKFRVEITPVELVE